jgi:hypothetical protein
LYFSDEGAVERAMHDAPPEQRTQLALIGFGYWHLRPPLGVVAVAAGLKKALGSPYDPLGGWIAAELAIPLGTDLAATAQVGALAAILAIALIAEGFRPAAAEL